MNCGGPISREIHVVVVSETPFIRKGKEAGGNDDEGTTPLKQILDPPNYKYCNKYGTKDIQQLGSFTAALGSVGKEYNIQQYLGSMTYSTTPLHTIHRVLSTITSAAIP